MRSFIWFLAGAIALPVIVGGVGLIFLKTRANGFSARSQPSLLETVAAQTARGMALPAGAREKRNLVAKSNEALADAGAHWADHCAICHANDGSGQTQMGRQMYPPAPDMRKERTQRLTDGELFYIIENGIRLSGMPAWGGSHEGGEDSWKLVHFIRHLPDLSASEIKEMEKLNPKSPGELEEEKQEEQFLKGQLVNEAPKQHHHH
jgi:mono/diheme cytochrome c family protein